MSNEYNNKKELFKIVSGKSENKIPLPNELKTSIVEKRREYLALHNAGYFCKYFNSLHIKSRQARDIIVRNILVTPLRDIARELKIQNELLAILIYKFIYERRSFLSAREVEIAKLNYGKFNDKLLALAFGVSENEIKKALFDYLGDEFVSITKKRTKRRLRSLRKNNFITKND